MSCLYERIAAGEFQNRTKYVSYKKDPGAYEVYKDEERRIYDTFKEAALEEAGLSNHPKRDLIFDKAWEDGHACGHHEILSHLLRLAEFISELEKE